ncbi:MAG: hypothetical protein KAH14_02480 [Clostridiales bacterium]|nr:hypothetical protein [Clostridiales bacterium]
MDKSQAFKILNLDENASRRQVENKFTNLSRRMKNGEDLDIESIKQAYDLLMGHENREDNAGRLKLAYRKFMFHYKGWAILILISVVVISMTLVPIIFRRIPDLTVSFAGRFGTIDQDVMVEVLQEKLPEIDDILVEVMYLDEDGDSGEFDSGGRTRLSGLLISEEADILIVDDKTFNYIRSDNALMPLDDLIAGLDFTISEDRFIYGVDFETGEKMIFGISVVDDYLIYRTVYGESGRILTIAKRSEHIENVISAIEIIISYRSE